MVNQALAFVVETVFNIFILSVLVRFWMQACLLYTSPSPRD